MSCAVYGVGTATVFSSKCFTSQPEVQASVDQLRACREGRARISPALAGQHFYMLSRNTFPHEDTVALASCARAWFNDAMS